MMNFRTYHLAVEFYQHSRALPLRGTLRDQLQRAASSIVLNLAEGRAKPTLKDQLRFFYISLGSLRECQAILQLEGLETTNEWAKLDILGAHLHRLIERAS